MPQQATPFHQDQHPRGSPDTPKVAQGDSFAAAPVLQGFQVAVAV
jgi:hypothetical protein